MAIFYQSFKFKIYSCRAIELSYSTVRSPSSFDSCLGLNFRPQPSSVCNCGEYRIEYSELSSPICQLLFVSRQKQPRAGPVSPIWSFRTGLNDKGHFGRGGMRSTVLITSCMLTMKRINYWVCFYFIFLKNAWAWRGDARDCVKDLKTSRKMRESWKVLLEED